mgnify:CR=1 FL=1
MNRKDLTDILDSIGVDYELDSERAGLCPNSEKCIPYSEVKLPSEYFKQPVATIEELFEGYDEGKFQADVQALQAVGKELW